MLSKKLVNMLRAISSLRVTVNLKPFVDSWVFKLHYRCTYIIYMASALLVTLYNNASETLGKKINCIVEKKYDPYSDSTFRPFSEAVNNYCFITGTFTVQRPMNSTAFPYPGVAPVKPGDSVTVHTYYQWVPFVLFLQGVMFYAPHWLWKVHEGGVFKEIVQDLSVRDYLGSNLENYFGREERMTALSKYVTRTLHQHQAWAVKFFVCEFLNLVVVVATLFFTDWFLGGEFLSYGASVFDVANQDVEDRWDPMTLVFPKVAKCTFRTIGYSGTLQVLDTMCIIAANIVSEKVYLFLWVWLIFLTTVTSVGLLLRLLSFLMPSVRKFSLKMRVERSVHRELDALLGSASISDWFLLHSLAKNMERSVFSEFVVCLYYELSYTAETPPMNERDAKL